MRNETDSLGTVQVPDDALYGVHTARSIQNFGIAGEPLPWELIHAMIRIKWAAARASEELGSLPAEKADAICTACEQLLKEPQPEAFPIDVMQAGSGTSSHMNVNEVIALLARKALGGDRSDRQLIHPNDDVNCGQSTNNVFPSAIKVSCLVLMPSLLSELNQLITSLRNLAEKHMDVIRSARTHLQDAVPISFGQTFRAWGRALEKDGQRIEGARDFLCELGVGGNAVGTGVNTRAEFRPVLMRKINERFGLNVRVAEDGIENTQFLTDLSSYSSSLRMLATDLNKICNDVRLFSSGPRTGLGELTLPPVEPGSSIMPGKINPSICEAVNMMCMLIFGLDHTVQSAAAAGQLELNTHMPVIGYALIRMTNMLTRGLADLREKCIEGIQVNRDLCIQHLEESAGIATVLNPRLGYDAVAALVKESLKEKKTIKQLVLQKGLLSEDDWNSLVQSAAQPNL